MYNDFTGGNIMNFDEKLGYELRTVRLTNRKTLQNVADHMGLAVNTIAYYEKGKIPMTVEALKKYCEYLGVNWIEILEKIGD